MVIGLSIALGVLFLVGLIVVMGSDKVEERNRELLEAIADLEEANEDLTSRNADLWKQVTHGGIAAQAQAEDLSRQLREAQIQRERDAEEYELALQQVREVSRDISWGDLEAYYLSRQKYRMADLEIRRGREAQLAEAMDALHQEALEEDEKRYPAKGGYTVPRAPALSVLALADRLREAALGCDGAVVMRGVRGSGYTIRKGQS